MTCTHCNRELPAHRQRNGHRTCGQCRSVRRGTDRTPDPSEEEINQRAGQIWLENMMRKEASTAMEGGK